MELNGTIGDNLKQNATQADIERLCDEAAKYHFATVFCAINSCWTAMAAKRLAGTGVGVTTPHRLPSGCLLPRRRTARGAGGRRGGRDHRDETWWSMAVTSSLAATSTSSMTHSVAVVRAAQEPP